MAKENSRKFTSLVMTALFIFSALAVMNFASTNVRAADPPPWNGGHTVNTTEWYENCNITMQGGNLTIQSGGILTFNDSVAFEIINPSAGFYGINIESGGQFIINSLNGNTNIISGSTPASRTYWFLNSGTLNFTGATVERVYGYPDTDYAGGIVNEPGSVCILEDCKIYDSDTHGICVDDSDLTISGSETVISPDEDTNNDGCGIWISGEDSDVSIEQITIDNVKSCGIKCVDAKNVIIEDNVTIKNSDSDGIYISHSTVDVKYCSIYDNVGTGISCLANSTPVIQGCNITSNYDGINVSNIWSNLALIDYNLIQGNQFSGIYCENTNITISNNNISSSAQALTFRDDMESGSYDWQHNGSLWNWSNGNDLDPPSSSSVSHSGVRSWVYNQSAGAANETLISENIDLSGSSGATVRFWTYYEVDEETEIESDPRCVIIKSSGTKGYGSSSVQLSDWESAEWTVQEIDLSEYDEQTVNLTFDINSLTGTLEEYQRWFVDDVVVYSRSPPWWNPTPTTGNGIECIGNVHSYIYNNNVSLGKLSGIYFKGWNKATVDGNTIQYNKKDGIELSNANETTMENNNVSYNDCNGVLLSENSYDNSLIDNTVYLNRLDGIYVSGSNYNDLNENTILSNSKNGIRLESAGNNNMANNTISSNNDTGIYAYPYSTDNEIIDNTIQRNKGCGINLISRFWNMYPPKNNNTNTSKIVNNTISSNECDGVSLYESDSNTIVNNTILSNGRAAIHLLGSENNTIENNNISADGEYTYRTFSTDGHYEIYSNPFVPYSTSTVCRPEAIYVDHTDCTYMVYMNWSFVTYIVEYNHTTDTFSEPVAIEVNPAIYDDHCMPALCIDGDGYIYVYYSQCGESQYQYYKKSTEPYDIKNWGRESYFESDLPGWSGWSYPQVWFYPPTNEIKYIIVHVFEEWSDGSVYLNTYNLSTGTYYEQKELINFSSNPFNTFPYTISTMDPSNNNIHLAWSRYFPYVGMFNVWHMNSSDGGVTWWSASGINLTANLPLDENEMGDCLVYNSTDHYCIVITGNINVNASGSPLITFGTDKGEPDNPTPTFMLARWDEDCLTGWKTTDITNCGNNQNQICMIPDNDTHFRAYCVDGPDFGGSLNEFISNDSGATWTFNGTIASGVTSLPTRVYNAKQDKSLELMFGGGSFTGNVNAWGQNIPQESLQISTRSAGIVLDTSSNHTDNKAYYNVYPSNYNTVVNNKISNASQGIALYHGCIENLIANNNASNNGIGIGLYSSANSTISNNNASSNDWGIILNGSSYNNITDNEITENSYYGIYLNDTTQYNSIYHNNFIYNCLEYPATGPQAYDNGTSNEWDNGYPSGGNYWSDYNETDSYGGPSQNLSGSDGIGDTPYDIDNDLVGIGEPQDHYPMMYENRDTYTYWAKTYGNSSTENLYWKGIYQTRDGGYIVAGFTNSDGAGCDDFWVLKIDANGSVEWQKTYGGSSYEEANAITQTSDGGYIVAGYTYSYGAGGADMWVIKLNEWGNITWNYTYGGSSTDSANSIIQTADGGYIVAGYTCSYGTGYADYWVLKLESDGDVTWNRTYGGTDGDYADSVIQTSDGNYTVGGICYSFGAGNGADYWVLKLNSTNGNILWNKTYGFADSDEILNSIMQTSDGNYIVGGYTYSGGFTTDYWLLKLESDGDVTWQYTYGDVDYDDVAVSIDETSDGGYIVAGYTASYGFGVGNSYDFWVLKLYQNGTVNWQKTYGGSYNDLAWSIEETSDGGFIVAGYTSSNFSSGSDDCWIIKIGPNGGITFDENSWAYVSDTDATVQITSCAVDSASTGVKAPSITPGTTAGKVKEVNFTVGTQATPSYGWYRKDGLV
jgi:parallel beta-helix repeat protein